MNFIQQNPNANAQTIKQTNTLVSWAEITVVHFSITVHQTYRGYA